MKIKLFILPALLLFLNASVKAQQDTAALIGRWDMTITTDNGKQSPSWFEVYRSGVRTLVGEFVGSGGRARPGICFSFYWWQAQLLSASPMGKRSNDLSIEGAFTGDSLTGTITYPDGKQNNWTAVHAPDLKRTGEPAWGQPQKAF